VDLAGREIGPYRVLRRLGEGGLGRAWLAEHRLVGRPAVLKQARLEAGPAARAALLREAAVLWDVRHWALPALRDVIVAAPAPGAPEEVFLVTSFIPGDELGRAVRARGPLVPEDACWVAERVLTALGYLHFRGIVHRDVKPTNVIVEWESHVATLVDFGLACERPGAGPGERGGTPGFAAPEQAAGAPALPESDLYALGVTVLWALGGDLARREVPEGTPAPVHAWIASLVRERPEERPRSADAALASLKEARRASFGRERTR
jgi:serine/threonine-protein kinase